MGEADRIARTGQAERRVAGNQSCRNARQKIPVSHPALFFNQGNGGHYALPLRLTSYVQLPPDGIADVERRVGWQGPHPVVRQARFVKHHIRVYLPKVHAIARFESSEFTFSLRKPFPVLCRLRQVLVHLLVDFNQPLEVLRVPDERSVVLLTRHVVFQHDGSHDLLSVVGVVLA